MPYLLRATRRLGGQQQDSLSEFNSLPRGVTAHALRLDRSGGSFYYQRF
jgi:hypothetical protein